MGKIRTDTYPDVLLTHFPTGKGLVIFDVEFTAWEGSQQRNWAEPWEYREVIHIGAVQLEPFGDSFAMGAEFDVLVRPRVNRELSDYITALTGITNAMIGERGVAFPQAMGLLSRFVKPDAMMLCNGLDGMILRENCTINHIPYPFPPTKIGNVRSLLANALGISQDEAVSSELLVRLGLEPLACKHSGVWDAKSVASSLIELRRRKTI